MFSGLADDLFVLGVIVADAGVQIEMSFGVFGVGAVGSLH